MPLIRKNHPEAIKALLSLHGYRFIRVRKGGPKWAADAIIGDAKMGVHTFKEQIRYLHLMGYRLESTNIPPKPKYRNRNNNWKRVLSNRVELLSYRADQHLIGEIAALRIQYPDEPLEEFEERYQKGRKELIAAFIERYGSKSSFYG